MGRNTKATVAQGSFLLSGTTNFSGCAAYTAQTQYEHKNLGYVSYLGFCVQYSKQVLGHTVLHIQQCYMSPNYATTL